MSLFRWFSVAYLTLAATSALHAQPASFSVLGLTALLGQETPGETAPSVLPWIPLSSGNVFGLPFQFPFDDDADETEETPAPRPCERCASFVPRCLQCWKEQWHLGNYREAELLASIACRLEPANVIAQHARVLAEIMQGLSGESTNCRDCTAERCADPPLEAAERAIERRLNDRVTFTFNDTPLREVISELQRLTALNITTDRAALREAKVGLNTPVTLRVDGISLNSALNKLLSQVKLTHVVKNGVLQITTRDRARGPFRQVVYPVADLPRRAPDGTPVEELLINLIQSTVAQNTWSDFGGQGTIQYYPKSMALVVNQSEDVQEDIASLLEALRRLPGDMQAAAKETRTDAKTCAGGSCGAAMCRQIVQALFGVESGTGAVKSCAACAGTKACSKEAGCCERTGTAKTCACAAPKEEPACCCAKAAPATASCRCAKGADCCCTKKAVAAAKAVKCDCAAECACCKCASPQRTSTVLLPHFPLMGIREVGGAAPSCPVLKERWETVHPEPRHVPGPVIAVSPPIYVSGPMLPPPPAGMPPLPPGFGPGMLPGIPTPEQAVHDLQCARAAALSNMRAFTGWQALAMPGQPVARHSVHFATPQLEAHCEKLTSAGNPDEIVLEGDVHLTCKRNGQTVRIQGQRVVVHLASGSFTVESTVGRPCPAPPTVSPMPPAAYYQTGTYVTPPVPRKMVRPAPPTTEFQPYEPE
jgi:hypothetical protein